MPWLLILVATVAYPKTVELSWDPSPSVGVSSYTLYWDNTPNIPFANSVDVGLVLNHEIVGLDDNEDHYFAVTASDALGNESTYSNIVKSDRIFTLPELDLNIEWQFIK